MIKFEEKDIQSIVDIIGRYQKVSADLLVYLDEAEKIQKKVTELEESLNTIKEEEDTLMEGLHSSYGSFTLQDVYDAITNGESDS